MNPSDFDFSRPKPSGLQVELGAKPKSRLRAIWLLPVLVFLAVVTGATPIGWSPSSSPAPGASPEQSSSIQPKITWSGKQVEIILSPGETATRDFTFTSDLNIQKIVIGPVPEIAPFVSVQPNSFANVVAGRPQSVRVTFSIPPGASLGTYDGTVHVRVGNQTLSQTLKVLVNVWQDFTDPTLGASFKYPPRLTASTRAGRGGTEVVLIDQAPASPDLAVILAFQIFPTASVSTNILDLVGQRLSSEAILSTKPLATGILVEADTLHRFHYFQYSDDRHRGVEFYGATEELLISGDFAKFLSTLRF